MVTPDRKVRKLMEGQGIAMRLTTPERVSHALSGLEEGAYLALKNDGKPCAGKPWNPD